MLSNDLLAALITFILALTWLRVIDYAASRSWISSKTSRKIIHTGTGPLFVLCWLLFTDSPTARYLAAVVPLAITLQFLLVGLGIIKDEKAVKAMSRSGDRREILKGPLYYGLAFVLVTIAYWRTSPVGITALMLLCGGDGLAEILGRRFGRARLPWNPHKSWSGTLGMFLGGWVFSTAVVFIFAAAGFFPHYWQIFLGSISLIALAGTAVESLPLNDIDNLTITATSLLLGYFLF